MSLIWPAEETLATWAATQAKADYWHVRELLTVGKTKISDCNIGLQRIQTYDPPVPIKICQILPTHRRSSVLDNYWFP